MREHNLNCVVFDAQQQHTYIHTITHFNFVPFKVWFIENFVHFIAMYAICYFCNKKSNDWCRNFTEIKSQHTQTPITEFIRQFLDNFESPRDLNDENNHICAECLQEIDDYDWMKEQAIEQEAKLRYLLLSTEAKIRANGNFVESENDATVTNGLEEMEPNCEIKLEINPATMAIDEQQVATTASPPPQQQLSLPPSPTPPPPPPSSSQSLTIGSVLSDSTNLHPDFRSNPLKHTIVPITNPTAEPKNIFILQNDQFYKVIMPNRETNTQMSDSTLQYDNDILVSTTTNPVPIPSSADSATTPMPSMNQDAIKKRTRNPKYPQPVYSYSCLIGMALKNSRYGSLRVSEIFNFICEHFPYFKTSSKGWKNTVRRTLSAKTHFYNTKIPNTKGGWRKNCVWATNPLHRVKLDKEIQQYSFNEPTTNRMAMAVPNNLPALLRGEMKHGHLNGSYFELDDNDDSDTENDQVNRSVDDAKNKYNAELEDSKLFQYALNAENGPTEIIENDLQQPMGKRTRLDINSSDVPARAPLGIASNVVSGTMQK